VKRKAVLIITLLALMGCEEKQPTKEVVKKEPKTYAVSVRKVKGFIEATGTVQPDLEGGAKILTPLAGGVEKIFVRVGDPVGRGTLLASVRSSDVSDAHSGYLSAQAQLRQAEQSYQLNKKLFEIGAVTKNDLLTSESAWEQARAVAGGLKKKLEIYGSSSGKEMKDTLVVKSPIAGRVVDIQAHIGDRFDTATPLMTVANPSRSLIVANIYDTDINKIAKGKEVTFTTDVFPQETFTGMVTYVSDVEDADSKTLKTYIKPLSGTTLFKQNMFLKIRIVNDEKALPVIGKDSMIYKDGKFYVRVKGKGTFELREVKPIMDVSDKLVAVEGVREGEVVASGAIDMEQP